MDLRSRQEDYINLNPLQVGGRTSANTRLMVNSYLDGYAVCDQCSGALHQIPKPDIAGLTAKMANFLGADLVRFTHGVREAKYLLMKTLLKKGDIIVVDGNAHYSTYLAAERVGVEVYSVSDSGYPEYKIKPSNYRKAIRKVKKKTGKMPKLLVLTQVDGQYGNLVDAKKIAQIAKEFKIPLLINSAYLAGRTKVNLKKIGANFIVASGHKSFGAPGTIGALGITKKWVDKLFYQSKNFSPKEVELLGCAARNAAIIGLAVAMETIEERIKLWPEELKKTNWLVEKLEALGEIKQLGEKPKQHDLVYLETPILDKIAKTKRKRGYFLAKELKKKGIIGIRPGLTKKIKFSTYGLTWPQVKYVYQAFKQILKEGEHGI